MAVFQAGPYQSQVFRFINRKVRRWRDRLEVTLRQLKGVASWSGQILLYPVYVAYQAVRLASAKFQQLTASYPSQEQPAELVDRPSPPQVDTPVQQVLLLAQALVTEPDLLAGSLPHPALLPAPPEGQLVLTGIPALTHQRSAAQELPQRSDGSTRLVHSVSSCNSSIEVLDSACLQPGEPAPGGGSVFLPEGATGPIRIQGIATLLETRGLVLVTAQNHILNILTPAQQQQLRQRMIWEMAVYGRYQRLHRASQRVLSRIRPAGQESPVLAPVKQFQALMAWVQSGPIAIAANLFQEETLEPDFPLLAWNQSVLLTIASPSVVALELRLPSSPGQPAPPPLLVEHDHSQETPGLLVPAPLGALTHAPILEQQLATKIKPELERHPYQPHYIDIQATLVEYTQTHLQRFFRLLDSFFLWMEEFFTTIWRYFS